MDHYLRRISQLPTTKQIGDEYENYARKFLAGLNHVQDCWLLNQVPPNILALLGMADNDVGIDGLIKRTDGIYLPFQVKYRSSGSITYSELATSLSEYQRLRFNFPHIIGSLIIFTNLESQPSDRNLDRYSQMLFWILKKDQLNPYGDSILKDSTPTTDKLKLRDYQEEDLQRLKDAFHSSIILRALFHAVMGYGKSVCITTWIEYILQIHPQWTIVVVVPYLKLSQQLGSTFDRNFSPILKVHTFDSENTTQNVPIGTSVVLTTNKSFPKLINMLGECQMILVDEVHRFKHWQHTDGIHLVGFTATPVEDTLKHLTPVVQRKLGWAIEKEYLTDYQVTGFVWPTDSHEETTKMNLYSDMIKHIFEKKYSSRMLVICSTVNMAKELAALIRKKEINCYAITSETKPNQRLKIENFIMSDGGVLVSVNIYKEGVDLVRLDSVMILIANSSEVTMGQILGRPLRKHSDKDMARIYFPILAGDDYTDLETPAYQSMMNMVQHIGCHDPDIYSGSGTNQQKMKKVNILFHQGSNRTSHVSESEEQIADDISTMLSVRFYSRIGRKISSRFNANFTHCTIAGILILYPNVDRFPTNAIKKLGPIFKQYIGSNTLTPEQSISRSLSEDLIRMRLIRQDKRGEYIIVDRAKMWQTIGSIPENFPSLI